MQFAVSKTGTRVHISEAIAQESYDCPFCGSPMIQRHGVINIPHFAHAKGYLCSDTWHYEEMSDWHREWQSRYPLDCQEVVMKDGDTSHRADVCINHTVIEFQHSNLSVEEFTERNQFYAGLGYKVIWLFDARDDYQISLMPSDENKCVFHWKHAPKTLSGFDLYGDIQVYFHLKNADQDDDGAIIRLTWCSRGDLSYFKSALTEHYSENEFVELTSQGIVSGDNHIQRVSDLFHLLYAIRRKNKEIEWYGCPLNEDGFAPQIQEHSRSSCDECPYMMGYDTEENALRCSGRFSKHLQFIRTVLEISRTDEGAIYAFEYIDTEGRICRVTTSMPESPKSSIIELAKDYNAGVMIVLNTKTGYEFKITKDPEQSLLRYGQVYGYMRLENRAFARDSRPIYYHWKPDWIVKWFVPKEESVRS